MAVFTCILNKPSHTVFDCSTRAPTSSISAPKAPGPVRMRATLRNAAVSADEEQARLLPVIEGLLKARPQVLLSADTYKSSTARAAVSAGAEIVNDVSGLLWDDQMARTCAELRCGVVLMHTRGKPDEWRNQPPLPDDAVLPLVYDGLAASLAVARNAGIAEEAIVLDPGYGFGKRMEENYALLARQSELLSLGRPLLIGLSRKSFLSRTLAKLPIHAQQTPSIASRDARQRCRSHRRDSQRSLHHPRAQCPSGARSRGHHRGNTRALAEPVLASGEASACTWGPSLYFGL